MADSTGSNGHTLAPRPHHEEPLGTRWRNWDRRRLNNTIRTTGQETYNARDTSIKDREGQGVAAD